MTVCRINKRELNIGVGGRIGSGVKKTMTRITCKNGAHGAQLKWRAVLNVP